MVEVREVERINSISLSYREQALIALVECLTVLQDESKPLPTRYADVRNSIKIISTLDSITIPCIDPNSSLDESLQSVMLDLLKPRPYLLEYLTPDILDYCDYYTSTLASYHAFSYKILIILESASPALAVTPEFCAVIASFTSAHDSWTTPETRNLCLLLLLDMRSKIEQDSKRLLSAVLRSLKLLFSDTSTHSSSRITSGGRIAVGKDMVDITDCSTPEWEISLTMYVPIIEWVVETAPSELISDLWSLLIPPILRLNDSPKAVVRLRAVEILNLLLCRLQAMKSTLLERSGLAPVFWDALMPSLTYLPPLIPAAQSGPLLKATFVTLRNLAAFRFRKQKKMSSELLDVLVHDGLIKGVVYAHEQLDIADIIIEQLGLTIQQMAAWTIPYLKDITVILSEYLTNPFCDTCPQILHTVLRAQQIMIGSCWSCILQHAPEILRGLVLCWVRIEADDALVKVLGADILRVVHMLNAVSINSDTNRQMWQGLQDVVLDFNFDAICLFSKIDNRKF